MNRRTTLAILSSLALSAAAGAAAPLGNSFSYQGRLTSAGAPINGSADVEISLWDADSAGNQIGSTQSFNAVTVEDGLFNAELDFGAGAFDGDERWIEIAVRSPAGSGSFTTLAPRQKINAAPYALRALETPQWQSVGNSIMNSNTGFVGINRDYAVGSEWFGVHAPVNSGYGGMYISTEGAAGQPFYGYIQLNGGHNGWHYLDTVDGDWRLSLGGTDRMTVTQEGDVGIGTTSPTAKLQIAESDAVAAIRVANSGSGAAAVFSQSTSSATANTVQISSVSNDLNHYALHVSDLANGGASFFRSVGNGNGLLSIASGSGSAGVFQAEGGGNGILVNQTSFGRIATFQDNGVDAVVIDSQGDLGIGTTNPVTNLDVRDASTSSNIMNIERTAGSVANADLLQIEAHFDADDNTQFIECERGSDIEFRVWGDGDISTDGLLSTGGADFAEMVFVTHGAATVEPGDVMVIDPQNTRAFVKSSVARSTLVAGIYSTEPGILASEHDWDQVAVQLGARAVTADGEVEAIKPTQLGSMIDEVPLAVVGIVPCKVSTENGAIRPGDLLVTSNTPGHAMRDDNAPNGTIVGKALGGLNNGTGVIRVLVTLQ